MLGLLQIGFRFSFLTNNSHYLLFNLAAEKCAIGFHDSDRVMLEDCMYWKFQAIVFTKDDVWSLCYFFCGLVVLMFHNTIDIEDI